MEYLCREYGQVKTINLNKSAAPTFEDALKKEPGVSHIGVVMWQKPSNAPLRHIKIKGVF